MTTSPHDIGTFTGLWPAIVRDNVDPDNKSRARVHIYGIHDDNVDLDEYPWAKMCSARLGNLRGQVRLPALNEAVWVMFEQGHPEHPVILGSRIMGLDTRNESNEDDIAGDDTRVVEGIRQRVSFAEREVVGQDSIKEIGGEERTYAQAQRQTIVGPSVKESASENLTTSGSRVSTIGASDETSVRGDQVTSVLGQQDNTVAGDKTSDIMGQYRVTANNVSGTPLVDNAILEEAVNGFATYLSKTIANATGSKVELDPTGLRTQLYSLVNVVIKAVGSVEIQTPLIRLGGATAVSPVTMIAHGHTSPFLGLPTGPAIDLSGAGLGIALGVLAGPPTPTTPEQ